MEDFGYLMFVIVVFVMLFSGFSGIIYVVEGISCSQKWQSFPSKYELFSGCQIQVDGKWIPAESYYFKEE